MDLVSETGVSAGMVYQFLDSCDSRQAKLSEIKKKVKAKHIDYALGWLLREGKISVEASGKAHMVRLN